VPEAERPDRQGALTFGMVGGVFALLLALGVGLGAYIHGRYVAFERVVGRHVPADAAFVLRWDVEKVTLFEPTRRYLLPLVELGQKPEPGAPPASRAARLERATGLSLGRDLREVLVVLGPGADDWAVVAGGSFPDGDVLTGAEPVLTDLGFRFSDSRRSTMLGRNGLALARVDDGAFATASDATALGRVTPRRADDPAIPRTGAASLVIRLDRPGVPDAVRAMLAPLGELAELRTVAEWGSPLPVEVSLRFKNEVPADVTVRFRELLAMLLLDPTVDRRVGPIVVQPAGNHAVKIRLRLDDAALETLAEQAKQRVAARIGAASSPN